MSALSSPPVTSATTLRLALIALACTVPSTAQDKKPARVECRFEFLTEATKATKSLVLTVVVPGDWPGRQTLLEETFEPKPTEILVENGTRYARFELEPPFDGRKITISSVLELRAPGLGVPKLKKGEDDGGADPRWLEAEKGIELEDPAIREMAQGLKGKKPQDVARSAAEQTSTTLRPSGYDPVDKGAAAALEAKAGDCSEFSDLMVALMRVREVPARRVGGLLTDWMDTPKHGWVEVHIAGSGWTMFDPIRGKTSPDKMTGPNATYIWLTPIRNDDRLAGYSFYHFASRGGVAKVVGNVFLRTGRQPERSAPL